MVIIGAGVNQWYHSNLMYRAAITGLMLCGCVGRNGGGMNHYVGPGEAGPLRTLDHGRLRARLDQAAPAAERPLLPVRELRPVALRRAIHPLQSCAAGG